jgi:hypothetical protein
MTRIIRKSGVVCFVIRGFLLLLLGFVAVVFVMIIVAIVFPLSRSGKVKDEAMMAGRTAESMPAAADDYFHDMDGGIALNTDEIKGRNNWIVWKSGLSQNDIFISRTSRDARQPLDLPRTGERALL